MGAVILKKGQTANLPSEATLDTLLVAEDTGRLFKGQGTGNPLLELARNNTHSEYVLGFTNANLSAGILTVTHNLKKFLGLPVVITDNNNKVVIADVTYVDSNTLTVDLSDFGTITGTWHVCVGVIKSVQYQGYETTFNNAFLSSGILTVTHNLDKQFGLPVVLCDNNNKVIVPDEITYTSANVITIDLSTYGTLTGTWYVGVGILSFA